MGRTKTYDPDEVTDRAMRVFWERGYHAASTRELADAMGINAYSLYAEFGSKEQLYNQAMERYHELVVTRHFGGLEAEDASLEQVEAVLLYFGGGPEVTASTLGCLACNAAIELAPTAQTSRASTDRYLARVRDAFGNALSNAQSAGRLTDDAPVAELAAYLAVTVTGMLVLIRAGSDATYLRATAQHALDRVRQFAAA
jgi:TetR/AcrR family transcriptional repressor of nem operon